MASGDRDPNQNIKRTATGSQAGRHPATQNNDNQRKYNKILHVCGERFVLSPFEISKSQTNRDLVTLGQRNIETDTNAFVNDERRFYSENNVYNDDDRKET